MVAAQSVTLLAPAFRIEDAGSCGGKAVLPVSSGMGGAAADKEGS